MNLEEKKILTQIYRWFSFYEKTSNLESQIEILSKSISIDSGLERIFGIEEYIKKVKLIPKEWDNLYKVLSYDIESRKNGSYIVNILVEYDNIGVLEDSKTVFQYIFSLGYEKHGKEKMLLPLIQSVRITPMGKHLNNLERGLNKVLGTLNYFYMLIDKNDVDIERLEELLETGFSLYIDKKEINTLKTLKKLLKSYNSIYKKLNSKVEEIQIINKNNNEYEIYGILTSNRLDRKDQINEKIYEIKCILEDKTKRFLKIKKLTV